MMIPIKPIILGKIGACYGVQGWLKVFSSTEDTEGIVSYQPWFIQKGGQWKKIKLEDWRCHNKRLIVKLKTVNNRESAVLLTNRKIIIDSSQLPMLTKGEYYWKDLIGCQVLTTKGYDLGKVINVIETGSNDVLLVKATLTDMFNMQERLIPFLDKQVIKKVSIPAQIIEVDWNPRF